MINQMIILDLSNLKESQRQLSERLERNERRSWSSAPGSSSQGNTLDRLVHRIVGCLIVGWLDRWLVGLLFGQIVGWLDRCLVGWILVWLVGSLFGFWLIG